jgi:hypothetical protein
MRCFSYVESGCIPSTYNLQSLKHRLTQKLVELRHGAEQEGRVELSKPTPRSMGQNTLRRSGQIQGYER